MYQSDAVKNHLEQSATVKTRAVILAEWNLNIAENIAKIGNYRYRPITTYTNDKDGKEIVYFAEKSIATWYDPLDTIQENNTKPKYNPAPGMYTNATDSDIIIDGGYDSDKQPIAFASEDVKKKILFSLEECFNRFRPRSGVNKMLFDQRGFINDPSLFFATRPRYYMASRDDSFKYWTSFRKEASKDLGYAYTFEGKNYINDACPFVVYKHEVPANRVVVKLQTNVGTETLPPEKLFDMNKRAISDPFFGDSNLTVPKEWKIEYLDSSNNWQTLKSFDGTSLVFGEDGYLEIQYGLVIPEQYTTFIKGPVINTTEFLPTDAPEGYAYLVIENDGDKGTYYIRNTSSTNVDYPGWDVWEPVYDWYVGNQSVDVRSSMVTNLTNPDSYKVDGVVKHREYSTINGLRLVVKTMNRADSRLDLIELSPRLAADLSDITKSYSITREAADMASTPLPIGSLVASTGSINLFDYDLAFNNYNKNSILNVVENNEIAYNISNKNIQIKIYEVIEAVNSKEYYIPIKTMYADGFPETNSRERSATITLRDLFFYFESTKVVDTLIVNQPISYVIATLLDSMGFTNYKFLRVNDEPDDIIPYFFISKDVNVAQILNELAKATQTAMYFDEFNNFVVASRKYFFPETGRDIDFKLKGSKDSSRSKDGVTASTDGKGIVRNKATNSILANIKDISSKQEDIYNSGKVTYSPKYIRKTVRNIQQASKIDKDRSWVYEPTLLWEVSETGSTKSINGEPENPQGYALTAIPLKTDLNTKIPEVVRIDQNGNVVTDPSLAGNPTMINNVINFGDSVYFVGRYNGYFYANGEIIRYDAVEYSVPQQAYTGFTGMLSYSNQIYLQTSIVSNNIDNIHVGDRVYDFSDTPYVGAGATIVSKEIITAVDTQDPAVDEDSVPLVVGCILTLDVPHKTFPNDPTTGQPIAAVEVNFTTTNTPNVWISSLEEYEKHFAKIPFNGKMYPTGRVRIYAEAPYNADGTLQVGVAKTHGRGQFNTAIVSHPAGLSPDWTDNVHGCYMNMSLLINGGKTTLSTSGAITYLSSTGTISNATAAAPFTAKIASIKHAKTLSVGQKISATNGVGNLGTGVVTVKSITSDTEIVVSSTAAITNGAITNLFGAEPYVVKISNLKSTSQFHIDQEIFASKTLILSESGILTNATGSSPYEAKLTELVSTDGFYVGQKLSAISGSGSFGSGSVTVKSIDSSTQVTLQTTGTGTTLAFTNGNVVSIKPVYDGGNFGDTSVIVVAIDSATNSVVVKSETPFSFGDIVNISSNELPAGGYKTAGITDSSKNYATNAKFDGMMKNYLANSDLPETVSTDPIKSSKIVQSSALIINGPSFGAQDTPVDYISYTSKKLNDSYKHFGTRVRIVGQSSSDGSRLQTPVGSAGWTTIDGKTVAGSSGGISVLLNPDTNMGYYFEIAALTDNNVTNYVGEKVPINNVFFYKLRAQYDYIIGSDNQFAPANSYTKIDKSNIQSSNDSVLDLVGVEDEAVGDIILFEGQKDDYINGLWKIVSLTAPWKLQKVENKAVPETLWSGMASIVTDSGQFSGMGRMVGESNPSVYDLAVEYKDIGSTRRFYLYINDIIVGVVDDTDVLPNINNHNIGLFARGSARLMFENVYALSGNYSENAAAAFQAPIADAFTSSAPVSTSSALTKYAVSGAVQASFLNTVSPQSTPEYNMYYDEFGTIMREAAYFNIKYDKAYPALRAMVAPTLNDEKGYTLSGFYGTPYGAEFLIFNNTDTVLALDETTGNYLRILGVTFTQESTHDLTVDDYFGKTGDLSSVENIATTNLSANKQIYQDIKNSRMTYGTKEFSLESPFIQSRDTAEKILEWVISKIAKPRKAIGISMFPNPLVQLGDLTEIDYFDGDVDVLGTSGSKFVVYSIEYQKNESGPTMTVHLSEVV